MDSPTDELFHLWAAVNVATVDSRWEYITDVELVFDSSVWVHRCECGYAGVSVGPEVAVTCLPQLLLCLIY